jgi:hypothetical protein
MGLLDGVRVNVAAVCHLGVHYGMAWRVHWSDCTAAGDDAGQVASKGTRRALPANLEQARAADMDDATVASILRDLLEPATDQSVATTVPFDPRDAVRSCYSTARIGGSPRRRK